MSHAVFWAGIPCALDRRAPTRYTHARGWKPATASVAIPRKMLTALVPAEPAEPFALGATTSPALLASLNSTAPVTDGAPVPMPFVGDLLIVQDDGDGTPRVTVRARQMYFAGAIVVDPEHQDRTSSASDPLLAVQLVGIQDFWDDYGEITQEWNRLRGPVDPRASADFRGAVDVATSQAAIEKRYTAPTSKNGGRDPTHLREILQDCLDALPGALQITRWPDAPAPPDDLRGWGASPKEILVGLCSHYGLHPSVGPDLSVRIFLRGEGVVGQAGEFPGDDNDQAHDPEAGTGAWADAVTATGDRFVRRPSRRPDQVLVVGDRTIMDAAVDWCRPVLYYQEAPDQADGRKPPAPVVLEVTPDNLAALASGRIGGEAADADALAKFLLALSPVDAGGAVAPFPPVAGAPSPELASLVWQRLVLVGDDGGRWAQVIPGMPDQVRELLQAQLGRVFQVGPEFARLLPLAERATRDHRGDRLPVKVEAFGFRAIRGKGKRPSRASSLGELEGDLPGAEAAARKEATDQLAVIRREIEEDRKRIKMLTGPTLEELKVALGLHHRQRREAGNEVGFSESLPSLLALTAESAAQNLGADPGVGYALLQRLSFGADSLPLSDDAEAHAVLSRARGAERRLLNAWSRKFGVGDRPAPEAMDSESVKAEIREIEERIKRTEANYRERERALNPKLTKQNELAAAEQALTNIRAQTGREPRAERIRADALRAEIDKLEEREAKALEQEEQDVEVVTHLNLARRSVPFTVLDRALGIFRVDGPTPPVWLANTASADPAETFAYFMPARVTFGTTNSASADFTSGSALIESPQGFYLSQMLAAMSEVPELADLLGVVGHVLPDTIGGRSTRFGFTRGDLSGNAKVDRRRARRITVDSSPPFRELVELGGASNREQLRARALVLARALLERPVDLPDGSLTLRGPRVVLCNGVISAVDVRWAGAGGFVTEVSFHVDTEPLPGVEGEAIDPGAARFAFGLDTEATRDL